MKKRKKIFGFIFYLVLSIVCLLMGFWLHVSNRLVFAVLYYIVSLLFAMVSREYRNGIQQ